MTGKKLCRYITIVSFFPKYFLNFFFLISRPASHWIHTYWWVLIDQQCGSGQCNFDGGDFIGCLHLSASPEQMATFTTITAQHTDIHTKTSLTCSKCSSQLQSGCLHRTYDCLCPWQKKWFHLISLKWIIPSQIKHFVTGSRDVLLNITRNQEEKTLNTPTERVMCCRQVWNKLRFGERCCRSIIQQLLTFR